MGLIRSTVGFSRVFIFVSMLCLVGTTANAKEKLYPKGTPTRAIQDLDKKMDQFKVKKGGKPLSEKDKEFNANLKREIIHGTFDIRELSKLSLAKHWNEITPAQQNHFVDVLVNLLEEKALFSKEQSMSKSKKGGKYYVVYYGSKTIGGNKERTFVRTKVVVPAENIDIKLNYKLKKVGDEWKIYDVIVDEASLLQNYKYQFDVIIKKHGYDELVRRMEKKLGDIKKERQ